MPITLFLAGQDFELEVIESMSAAFVAACDALQLKVGVHDPATRFVAEKVIELAKRGVCDPDVLRTMTLKEFGLGDESALAALPLSQSSDAPQKQAPRFIPKGGQSSNRESMQLFVLK